MKKHLLFLVMVLAMNFGARAQNAAMQIDATAMPALVSCSVSVQLYATSATLGSTGCNDIVTNFFVIPPATVYNWLDPVEVEIGGFGGPAVGWASLPSGGSTLGGVYPSDFQWTGALFDYQCVYSGCIGGLGGYIQDNGIGCFGTGATIIATIPWCTGGERADWTPALGSALSNITLTFIQ